jgi:drug/metabolite transporter (DMT)-like permease
MHVIDGEATDLARRGRSTMGDPVHAYRLVKLAVGGFASILVGIGLIATGESQSIVAGSGVLLAAGSIFGFLGWAFASDKAGIRRPEDGKAPEVESWVRVVWLGIALTLLSGVMYFYLRYAMTDLDPMALLFVNVPLLLAGLCCIGVGFWSAIKGRTPAEAGDAGDSKD